MKRYLWPICTVTGCKCRRSWETEKEADEAVLRYSGRWTLRAGHAICWCHGEETATFPCDKAERAIHHA